MYINFDCVQKTKNKGMNIAHWNIIDYKFEDGKIDGKYDPLFFHFSKNYCTTKEEKNNFIKYKKSCEYYRNLFVF